MKTAENGGSQKEVTSAAGEASLASAVVEQMAEQPKRILMLRRVVVQKSVSADLEEWRKKSGIKTTEAALDKLDRLILDDLAIRFNFDSSTDAQQMWGTYMDQISTKGLLMKLLKAPSTTGTLQAELMRLSKLEN